MPARCSFERGILFKTLILDLGGVFIGLDPERPVHRLCEKVEGVSPEDVFHLFHDSDLVWRYERGLIHSPSFYRNVKQQLGGDFSYAFFKELWVDMFFPIQSMIDLLPGLKDRYQLVLLSNTNALHIEYCKQQFPIFHFFDHLLFSHEVGLAKPDDAIFRLALERSACQPSECVFVDDTPKNVQAAGRMGITAFRFLHPECLEPLNRPDTCVSVEEVFLKR